MIFQCSFLILDITDKNEEMMKIAVNDVFDFSIS